MQLTEQSPSSTKIMSTLPTLAQAYFDELTETVRGVVYRRGDHQFVLRAFVAIFRTHFLRPHSGFKSIHAYSMETF